MNSVFRHFCLFTLLILFAPKPASPNSSGQSTTTLFTPQQLANFVKRVERTVASKGVQVFIIGRQGEIEENLPEGIRYTHTAFGVYSNVKMQDGSTEPAYVLHNLYQAVEKPNTSYLTKDFLIDYFSSTKSLKAGILIPVPELQRRLIDTIESNTYAQLHQKKYSAIANPFTSKYQNCTEHVLDVIQASIYQINSIEQIKVNSKAYFKPQRVNVSGLKLFFGSIFKSDIALSDHKDSVATATFTTIGNYLDQFNLLQERLELAAP